MDKVKKTHHRIVTIDLLRGYFIFVIIIDHLQRFPGIFELFTGKGFLWVSAAEGFFFISGMMVGLIRGQRSLHTKLWAITRKLWHRSFILYLWGIGLSFLFSVIGLQFVDSVGLKPGLDTTQGTTELILKTIFVQQNYGWADYLVHYAVFLFFAPAMIWFLRKGKWYLATLISVIVWSFSGHQFELAWQLLFFNGMIVGFYLEKIEKRVRRMAQNPKKILLYSLCFTTVITISASVFFVLLLPYLMSHNLIRGNELNDLKRIIDPYFNKEILAIGRVGLFGLWFSTAYWLVRRHEQRVDKVIGWLFTPFGQNSLYVYIVHATLLFGLNLLIADPNTSWIFNVFITSLMTAILWLMVKRKILFSVIPR